MGQKWKQEGHLRDCCVMTRRGGSGRPVAGDMMMVQDMFEVALRRPGVREGHRETKGSCLDDDSRNCLSVMPFIDMEKTVCLA